jgi:CheY-like chemotaxis protein
MTTPKNIYLSDDDCDDVYFIKHALTKLSSDCNVTVLEDGEKLLNQLQNCLQLPDLIFLDINMPVITGFEALKAIKANERFSNIPVVIFSTSKNEIHKKKSYELGAAYYLVKPRKFDEYKEYIKKMLTIDWKKTVRNDLENQDLVS